MVDVVVVQGFTVGDVASVSAVRRAVSAGLGLSCSVCQARRAAGVTVQDPPTDFVGVLGDAATKTAPAAPATDPAPRPEPPAAPAPGLDALPPNLQALIRAEVAAQIEVRMQLLIRAMQRARQYGGGL